MTREIDQPASFAQEPFAQVDLQQALGALSSTIGKCEKIRPTLKSGSSQHTLLTRRIKALYIAVVLIKRELQ